MIFRLFSKALLNILIVTGLFFVSALTSFADFRIGPDIEKPIPQFTLEGDIVAAKLIPRAKSTSVVIRFKVSGGSLGDVKGVDFYTADRPEVNIKNFKSALFEVNVEDVPIGGEAKISISSEFFTSATQYYVFNETLEKPWSDAKAMNVGHPKRVQELIIPVTDGGEFDADGAADGKIRFVGGPRDSFWGYALGTLFIRFFGIFLVLIVLMIGMRVSGKFFQWFETRKTRAAIKPETSNTLALSPKPIENTDSDTALEGDDLLRRKAAAIAVALTLHQGSSKKASFPTTASLHISDAWTQSGRTQMMGDRLMIFNR